MSFSSTLYGMVSNGPCAVRSVHGRSSTTQSAQYRMPASASRSGVLQRLGQTGRQPADDVVARRLAQRGDRVADHRALVLHQMRRDLAEAVTHELPAGLARRLRRRADKRRARCR